MNGDPSGEPLKQRQPAEPGFTTTITGPLIVPRSAGAVGTTPSIFGSPATETSEPPTEQPRNRVGEVMAGMVGTLRTGSTPSPLSQADSEAEEAAARVGETTPHLVETMPAHMEPEPSPTPSQVSTIETPTATISFAEELPSPKPTPSPTPSSEPTPSESPWTTTPPPEAPTPPETPEPSPTPNEDHGHADEPWIPKPTTNSEPDDETKLYPIEELQAQLAQVPTAGEYTQVLVDTARAWPDGKPIVRNVPADSTPPTFLEQAPAAPAAPTVQPAPQPLPDATFGNVPTDLGSGTMEPTGSFPAVPQPSFDSPAPTGVDGAPVRMATPPAETPTSAKTGLQRLLFWRH